MAKVCSIYLHLINITREKRTIPFCVLFVVVYDKHIGICSLAGVDVILDSIGQAYFKRNLDSLAFDGRLFVIGTLSGSVTELDLRVVLSKRLTIQGTRF